MKPTIVRSSFKNLAIIGVIAIFSLTVTPREASAGTHSKQTEEFVKWLVANRDPQTFLPYSHVGDDRFRHWTITYDAAITSMAYLSVGRIEESKRIVDFYASTPEIWRLGGMIEAFVAANPPQGQDWSVRMGANIWMGLASFQLYKKTHEQKYLSFAERIAEFALSLQNSDKKDPNNGGICLGPAGDPNFPTDQHLGYNENMPKFDHVYATEIQIDAYALFNLLFNETKLDKYMKGKERALSWLKRNAYNSEEHRLNRGFQDKVITTDIHSWAISALGPNTLNEIEPEFTDKILLFVKSKCLVNVEYTKPDGTVIKVNGVDFVDKSRAVQLRRKSLVSPEWTFQLINAYARAGKAYENKRQTLIDDMLHLAVSTNEGLAYPYATLSDVPVGHEYSTPKAGNMSVIGVAYAILALNDFDPLVINNS